MQIPSLMVQPLVENAISHGLHNKEEGHILITFLQTGSTIKITVTDNGNGLPAGFKLVKNHALQIISERIALMQKETGTGSFKIINNETSPGSTAELIFTTLKKTS